MNVVTSGWEAGDSAGGSRYQLRMYLGTGGTAEVWLADDLTLRRPVALKLFHSRLTDDGDLAARLEAEVIISRRLAHPGIVEVYDYAAGQPAFMAMEYMPGGDLRRRLLEIGSLPATEVARIGSALLEALSAAHERGVVHRDLKPRNVLFSERGEPKIADFGLARSITGAGLHQQDTIAGTPEYTSPETITLSIWDSRSDLYALGCTLFEAATGRPPFVANTPAGVLRLQVEESAPPMPKALRASHPDLARLLGALLRKDPNLRPQTAREALSALSAGGSLALEPAEDGSCPFCRAAQSIRYPYCFTCGRPNLPVIRRKEGYTVLVTGPGKTGEKIGAALRDRCLEIARAAQLQTERLKKSLPRLPFVLVSSADYGGAVRMRDELRGSGVEASLVGDGEERRLTMLRSIGRKALTMTPRVYVVILGMGGAWFNIFRSMPPGAVLAAFAALVAAVPVALTGSFVRSMTGWTSGESQRGGENLTRLLASVNDPLIHARMKSIVENSRGLVAEISGDGGLPEENPAEDQTELEAWAEGVVERAAGLCLALDAARSARDYSRHAMDGPADSRTAAAMLRSLDALYMRTLEQIGTTSLEIRELSLRAARVRGRKAAIDLAKLRDLSARLSDEGEAWREIAALGGEPE